MRKSEPGNKDSVDCALIKEINQLYGVVLGVGAVTCVACGSRLFEGREVLVYAYKPAGGHHFGVGYVLCAEHDEHKCINTTSEDSPYTIGVRELVVEGRIGTRTDVRTQAAKLVLLDPKPVLVSDATMKTGRKVSAEEYIQQDGGQQ